MLKKQEKIKEEYIPSEEELRELKSELEDYKKMKCNDLSFFGEEITAPKAKTLGSRYSGFVISTLFGFVHWSVVKYAFDKKYISKIGDVWCILGDKTSTDIGGMRNYPWVDISNFFNFKKRLDILKTRESKKDYAVLKSVENLEEEIGIDDLGEEEPAGLDI